MSKIFFRGPLVILALLSAGTAPGVQATLVDFEGHAAGTVMDIEYQSVGVTSIFGYNTKKESGPTFTNVATIFDTNNYTGGDDDLESPFSSPNNDDLSDDYNPGKVLILHERPDECDGSTCGLIAGSENGPDDQGAQPAGYFEIVFDSAVFLESLDFFDIEMGENDSHPDSEILLYGVNGLIGTYYTPDTGGDNTWNQVTFNESGVTSMIVELKGSGAIDNLSYRVPEPGTLALMGIGLFGLYMLNRRQALLVRPRAKRKLT